MAFFNLLALIIGVVCISLMLAVGILWVISLIGDSRLSDDSQEIAVIAFLTVVCALLVWFGTLL